MGKKRAQKKKKKPSVSLCMIVRNEEESLARCLESIRPCVDEMIIVDTGSTDRTVEIAKRYGAKIYHHPWENDFSKHRNQSLSYATGDWIVQLDADEELFAEDRSLLVETIRDAGADFYHCHFYDLDKHGSVRSVFNLIRLFRNGLGMHFTQKIHNQLQVKGVGSFTKIRVRHFGYDLSPEKMETKHIRTTTLLQEVLAQNPEDAYCRHQLAASYSMHQDYEKAIEHGSMALETMRRKGLRNSFFQTTFYIVAQGYYSLEDFASAERICREAVERFPGYLDVYSMLAAIYFQREDFDACKDMAVRYLQIYDAWQADPSLVGSGSCYCYTPSKRSDIHIALACIHFHEKDVASADAHFRKSFEDADRTMDKAEKICRFYFEHHMEEKAIEWLMRAVEAGRTNGDMPEILKDHTSLYLRMAKVFMERGDTDAAIDCFKKADDGSLTPDGMCIKRLSLSKLFWLRGSIDELVETLASLVALLRVRTIHVIDSVADLGQIIYDIASEFCSRQQWHLAEPALNLAVQVAPEAFDHHKFDHLIRDAERHRTLPPG